jgi:hypothetical protein
VGTLLHHIGTSAIMDLLLRLLTCVESPEVRRAVIEVWFVRRAVIELWFVRRAVMELWFVRHAVMVCLSDVLLWFVCQTHCHGLFVQG